jgi:hypothetical protein
LGYFNRIFRRLRYSPPNVSDDFNLTFPKRKKMTMNLSSILAREVSICEEIFLRMERNVDGLELGWADENPAC